MGSARYIVGDTRKVTATLPDGSVDLVLTSPPFLALRSYLPDDHPDKHREIGSEATPADFLDVLLDLTEEWARVLAPHGSIVVELGDTYSGSGGAGGDYADGGMRDGQGRFDGAARRARKQPPNTAHRVHPDGSIKTSAASRATEPKNTERILPMNGGRGWPLDKSLCGIPHLYHLSLAYGRNLLRPERLTDPWRIRNVVAWCRPNPPVGALGDKFRPATSYMTVATKARDRWFDLDAVREPFKHPDQNERNGARGGPTYGLKGPNTDRGDLGAGNFHSTTGGAPPLDWWQVSTEPYAGSHYATWPRKLLTRPILAMCPERVCTTCGEPSRRIIEQTEEYAEHRRQFDYSGEGEDRLTLGQGRSTRRGSDRRGREVETLGWSDCGHSTWRPGTVLDPFAGSGTTLAVATGHGRDAIGIDIDARNAELALERVGPLFLTIEQ